MIASEFAFLALGLVLGAASGAAVVIVLRSRPPAPEVRVTVSHDAVPRRAATLSSDVFTASAGEPARGGPADRRRLDRPEGGADEPGTIPTPGHVESASQPGAAWPGRTSVSFGDAVTARAGVPIVPERDEALEALRARAAQAAARMFGSEGRPLTSTRERQPDAPGRSEPAGGAIATATAPTVESRAPTIESLLAPSQTGAPSAALAAPSPIPAAASTPPPIADAVATAADPATEAAVGANANASSADQISIDETPALTRILRGDHHALFAVASALAANDSMDQRAWERAIRSVTDAIVARTIAAGCLDFPVGNPFWDTFTVPQCRDIAGALAAAGHRFDGVDGWEHGRVPNYRDLTIAVAGAGLEPRRVRSWPTQEEMDDLYLNVTAAPDEFVAVRAPNLDMEELHDLVGFGDTDRALLWANWDRARAILTSPIPSA
ncbi:MAG: hypothetical protein EPO00_04395 [Chloroflexota bacterium]|nr:MAG: hypothetical protein EPO00_04395 [Chloroflexota bacterium]